jgi:hypothetical protein
VRNPSVDTTPLDWASFYVEDLKFEGERGQIQGSTGREEAALYEMVLRAAEVTSMSGEELREALGYYAASHARAFGLSTIVARTVFCDGLLHGVALAGGLRGDHRDPR